MIFLEDSEGDLVHLKAIHSIHICKNQGDSYSVEILNHEDLPPLYKGSAGDCQIYMEWLKDKIEKEAILLRRSDFTEAKQQIRNAVVLSDRLYETLLGIAANNDLRNEDERPSLPMAIQMVVEHWYDPSNDKAFAHLDKHFGLADETPQEPTS